MPCEETQDGRTRACHRSLPDMGVLALEVEVEAMAE